MNIRNIFVPLVIIALAVLSFFHLGEHKENVDVRVSAFDNIFNQRKINIGYIVFPPTITQDPNSKELGGHFIETIREICLQAAIEPVFIETDWKGFSAGLKSGRFDVSIAPTFITIPRSISVAFTDPLFYAGNGVIVRKNDTRFNTIDDFNRRDITVAVTQGSAAHEFALSNLKNVKLNVLPGPDQLLTLQEVLSGRSDAGFANSYDTQTFVNKYPTKVKDIFSETPYNLTPVSWSVATDEPELLAFFNSALHALKTQGKLLQYEHAADAHWLHEVKKYRLNKKLDK